MTCCNPGLCAHNFVKRILVELRLVKGIYCLILLLLFAQAMERLSKVGCCNITLSKTRWMVKL